MREPVIKVQPNLVVVTKQKALDAEEGPRLDVGVRLLRCHGRELQKCCAHIRSNDGGHHEPLGYRDTDASGAVD